jgi:hypothetical protein
MQLIKKSLDQAVAHGYELDTWSAEDIAADLGQYDATVEEYTIAQVLPCVQAWKLKRLILLLLSTCYAKSEA